MKLTVFRIRCQFTDCQKNVFWKFRTPWDKLGKSTSSPFLDTFGADLSVCQNTSCENIEFWRTYLKILIFRPFWPLSDRVGTSHVTKTCFLIIWDDLREIRKFSFSIFFGHFGNIRGDQNMLTDYLGQFEKNLKFFIFDHFWPLWGPPR
jgi:hypothetical protein